MSDLTIPDAAVDAADIFGGQIRRGDLRVQIANAAPHIVAAELRRLADLHQAPRIDHEPSDVEAAHLSACDEIARALRARADELDGGDR